MVNPRVLLCSCRAVWLTGKKSEEPPLKSFGPNETVRSYGERRSRIAIGSTPLLIPVNVST